MDKEANGYKFYRRGFLNKPGEQFGAYILAEIPEEEDYCELTISDCSRVVSIEFYMGEKSRENSLYKARLLLKTIQEFVEALEKKSIIETK